MWVLLNKETRKRLMQALGKWQYRHFEDRASRQRCPHTYVYFLKCISSLFCLFPMPVSSYCALRLVSKRSICLWDDASIIKHTMVTFKRSHISLGYGGSDFVAPCCLYCDASNSWVWRVVFSQLNVTASFIFNIHNLWPGEAQWAHGINTHL